MFLIWLALALAPNAAVKPGLGEGFWHTRGSQLLDAEDRPVRIAGVNWFGFETTRSAPGGLDVQDYRTILQTIRKNGYNTIRIPFSSQMIESPIIPPDIKFSNQSGPINTDLKGLDSLQVLDRIVAYAGTQGLKIILDNHRSEAGGGPESNGLWYTQTYSESSWIEDWQMLARRYASNPTVIGFDLRNEPHNARSGGACWGCGGANDWRLAAERAGDAVLAINPKLLIFVEGVDFYENDFYWWGGNLMGVRNAPVRLKVPHQLVYSAHDYGPVDYVQSWFTPGMTSDTLNAVWRKHWAYIAEDNIAPVWLGEFGFEAPATGHPTATEALETRWFESLTAFLAKDTRIGWTYWALNGADRYGLLNLNYDTIRNSVGQSALTAIQFPLAIGNKSSNSTIIEPTRPPSKTRASATSPALPQPAPAAAPETQSLASTQPGFGNPPAAPLQCKVAYTNLNDWKSGYTAGIVVRNTGSAPIEGWVLTFTFDGTQKISRLWSGHLDQTGPKITINNETFNATIAPGSEQAGIGFNATYQGTNQPPTKFYLNGTLCK